MTRERASRGCDGGTQPGDEQRPEGPHRERAHEKNPDTAPDAAPEEVEPAFDIDLEPDEQGLAGSGEEPSG